MRLQIYQARPLAASRLFCFPCAGADAVLYRDWGEFLGPQIEVLAARYPGRGTRMTEEPKISLREICEDLKKDLQEKLKENKDKPVYFFGHSLGAIVAFELAVWLQSQGKTIEKLIVSGAVAPQESEKPRVHFHQWEDEAFQKKLISLGGIPEIVSQHPDLLNFLTPMIRADIQAIETYHYQETTPLKCPITVLSGQEDPVLQEEDLQVWKTLSHAEVKFISFPGKHFYFQEQPQDFFEILKRELR